MLDDKEVFLTPAAFVDEVTTEALRDFHRLDVHVSNARMSVGVTFLRHGRRTPPHAGVERGNVKLSVYGFASESREAALEVARVVCAAMERGHRRWHGRTQASAGIPASWRRRSFPRPAGSTVVARMLGGLAFAFLVLSTISTLFPDDRPSAVTIVIIACVSAAGSAHVLPALVPSIEIAEPGKTRLSHVTRWSAVTVLGLVLAQIVKKALGTE